ncbi:hypothetical protein [Gracilinema caldarium]|uniref:Uncharacterized protein n=1 Tax=Gracilinema caldarium (strain ATCC 51460 / DSM 7334 / H1) TaxID=744872 RepID=F8EZH9_GRAC1|nr:hypothetical protein [Gracilinema caldarium]AEJ20202.1 hypothetical protein Spica_2075 [Gracilinema caldarium DSM 7334]
MKKITGVLFLLTLSIVSVYADTSFFDLLDYSIKLWDATVPWVRLGTAPIQEAYDPAPILQDIARDMELAGRYKEFEYLFNFVENIRSGTSHTFRIINENPPSPGFWPAMGNQSEYAIVISSEDLEYLQQEPYLLRASLLRAISTLYYINVERYPAVWKNDRNPLYEFSAFMTGNHIESIYLREIVPFNKLSSIAKDWHEWLLNSAQYDNLEDVALHCYSTQMSLAYYYIRELMNLSNYNQVFNLYKSMYEINPQMLTDMFQIIYGLGYKNQQMIHTGSYVRTMLMVYPWVLLALQSVIPASNTDFQQYHNAVFEKLRIIQNMYMYMEPFVLKARQHFLNGFTYRLPDQTMTAYLASETSSVTQKTLPLRPETVKISWYGTYNDYGYTDFIGFLPMKEKEALATKAYRFSYNNKNELIAIESVYKGKLYQDEDFFDAAQVEIVRDETGERWYWKNAKGKLINNSDGFAILYIRNKTDGQYLEFYASDGRRIVNENGMWSIKQSRVPGGYEYYYLDGSGRNSTSYFGYSMVRIIKQGNSYDIRYFGIDGKPALAQSIGVHRVLENIIQGATSFKLETSFYDTTLQPCMKKGDLWMERNTISRDKIVYEILDQKGNPALCVYGFSIIFYSLVNGLNVKTVYADVAGKEVNTMTGFSRELYSYNADGNVTETLLFASNNKPAANLEGIHKKVMKYDKNGFLEELYYYDTNNKPANDITGAARIRWINDEEGTILEVDAWNANGIKLTNHIQIDL